MWVVKLGGSLLGTPELRQWLDLLARQSDGRVVIVPGGGIFADTVRSAQTVGGYDDVAAHHMALLGMEQYGLALQSLQPQLVTASSELEIAERSWQHRAIVWLPSQMVLADDSIPMNWEVTSDSLAAWLARKIGANRLVLVKHVEFTRLQPPLRQLVEEGVLDAAFTEFATGLACPIHVVDKSGYADFALALAGAPIPTLAF
ncbi:MAG TPA: uridylate kinase [Methylophilaceae bacterium]|nr:uridylate kinase [Methylophilaceae bacterium]HQR60969.1 uridylate kinase [Methylophilaceae bacterium]